MPPLPRALSLWLLPTLLIAGCGEVIELQAVVGLVDRSCQRLTGSPQEIRSIRVEAIEWYGGEPGEIRSSRCHETIEGLTVTHPWDLLSWFSDQNELLAGLPTDVPARVQVVGFANGRCELTASPPGPQVCGLSQDSLSETAFEAGDEVRLTFSCFDGDRPLAPLFICLSPGSGADDE